MSKSRVPVYIRPVTREEVLKLIEKLNMTHKEFAQWLGLNPQTVSSWVQGTRKPSSIASKVVRLALRDNEFVKEFSSIGPFGHSSKNT